MAARNPIALLLAGALIAACASTATPSAGETARPSSPSALPTASATTAPSAARTPALSTATPAAAAPTPPAGPLPRTAVVEQDGVRVRIELERNPMPAGEWTTLTATVRNTGTDVMTWQHGGSAIAVNAWGEMSGVAWRRGITYSGVAAVFKGTVLGYTYGPMPLGGPIIHFEPERRAGRGSFGSGDMAIGDLIRPGEAIRQRYVWDGQAALRWGPPPSGPVTLTGTFASYWRGRREPEGSILDRKIELTLDAWVVGGVDSTWLSPPEVVDAALADPAFVAYLETQELGNGREEILWYRPALGAWEVGVLMWYDFPEPRMHLVIVDPHTGAIRDTVDRPWDQERDGFP